MRIEVRELWAGYGRTEVLRGVSLEARDGEIVAIIGPNGAGKSTVLRAVYGQCDVRRGDVLLDGARLTGTPAHRLIRHALEIYCEQWRREQEERRSFLPTEDLRKRFVERFERGELFKG